MRRGLILGLLAVATLLGFYVAWPAWSARQIKIAIEANDPEALARKIDFPRVRESVRPVVAAEVQRSMETLRKNAGPLGAAIAGTLDKGLGTQLADAAVKSILTPANIITMVRQGKDFRRALDAATGRDTGQAGRRGEPPVATPDADRPAAPAQTGEGEAHRKLGLANIRSYRVTGLSSLAVGIARDPAANEPDITAELAFTGFDWKVVGLVPRL